MDVAEAVLTRDEQLFVVETAHDLRDGPHSQESCEDQVDAPLDLLVGMLEHAFQGVAHQPDR